MSFGLIIANPPYGKSSSLSKKIVNKMLEFKVAKEMVVLAPPTTFKPFLPYIENVANTNRYGELLTTGMFGDVNDASNIAIQVCKLTSNLQNKYTDYAEIVLTKKELEYVNAVAKYNKSHTSTYREMFVCTTKNKKDVQNALLISFWSGICQWGGKVRYGEMFEHNENGADIPWRDTSAPYAIVFENAEAFKNFKTWWYTCDASKGSPYTTPFKQFLFGTLYKRFGGTPALKDYEFALPHVDWSRAWTDQEILKEIKLPEDFLED